MLVFGLLLGVLIHKGTIISLKQRKLSLLRVDALAGFVVILLVQLETDEVPLFLDARHGSRPAAHAIIQNRVAFVAVCPNQVAQQVHRLLGGVLMSFVAWVWVL